MVRTQYVILAPLASGNLCQDNSKWTPEQTYQNDEGNTEKCSDTWDVNFVADAANCKTSVPGQSFTYAEGMDYLANHCCGGSASACDEYMQNPCMGEFDAQAIIDEDGATCGQMRLMLAPGGQWTPSKSACHEKISMSGEPGEEFPRAFVLHWGSKCCDAKGHVCKEWDINPCSKESDYQPDAKLTDSDGMICAQGIAELFQWNEVTMKDCDKDFQDGKTKKQMLDENPQCCSEKPTKCDEGNNSNKSSECAPRAGLAAVLLAGAVAAAAC